MSVKNDSLSIIGYQTTHERIEAGVYVLTHIPTMKLYVGSTVDLHQRMIQHTHGFRHGKHPNRNLQAACEESPRFNLSFRPAPPNLSKVELLDLIRGWEGDLLKQHRNSELLMNIALDPNCPGMGISPSPEVREKISKSSLGRFVSEITRQKRSEALIGTQLSEVRRSNISEGRTKQRVAVNGVIYKNSTEAAQRLGFKNKGSVRFRCLSDHHPDFQFIDK